MSFMEKEHKDTYKAILSDPRRLFNADETGFPLAVQSGKVLAPRGAKTVYHVATSEKTQITTLACFNAMGQYMAPLVLFPGKRIKEVNVKDFEEAYYQCTESGWMTAQVFRQFLDLFYDFLIKNNIPRPTVLFVDGHSSHININAAEFCSKNGIIVYCFEAHASHIMQPCDVGFFGPLKKKWQSHVRQWQTTHIGEPLTKKDFPGILKLVWESMTSFQIAGSAFRKCGLFPLNADAIDYSKVNPATVLPSSYDHHVKSDCEASLPGNSACLPSETLTNTSKVSGAAVCSLPSVSDLPGSSACISVIPISLECQSDTPVPQCSADQQRQTTSISGANLSQHPTNPVSSATYNASVHNPLDVSYVHTISEPLRAVSCGSLFSTPSSSHSAGLHFSTVPRSHKILSWRPPFSKLDGKSNMTNKGFVAGPVPVCSPATQSKNTMLETVSPAFALLKVPEVTTKRKTAMCHILPKAVSGSAALALMKEREDKKKKEEEEKLQRKIKREQNRMEKKQQRIQKLQEAQKKREERECMKRKKEQEKAEKSLLRKNKKCKKTIIEESSDEDSESDIVHAESDDGSVDLDVDTCPACGLENTQVGCDLCPRWWHKQCSGYQDIINADEADLQHIEFICKICQFS